MDSSFALHLLHIKCELILLYLPAVEEDEGVLEVAHVVERLRLDHHRLAGDIANAKDSSCLVPFCIE